MIVALASLLGAGAVVLVAAELLRLRTARASLARVAAYTAPVAVSADDPVRRFHGFRIVGNKTALAVVGVLVGAALGALRGGIFIVLVAFMFGALGYVAPDFIARAREHVRRERMLAAFPNALDLLAVIVEAGLGLDAALVRYAEKADGPLADEIRLLATELRVASSRADAFARFVERVPCPETRSFARAVVHADRLGTSLTGTLRAQATDARYRRQSQAEEQANKAPVKLLFPTVFCIFPALFVVVLGPPLITLLHSLR